MLTPSGMTSYTGSVDENFVGFAAINDFCVARDQHDTGSRWPLRESIAQPARNLPSEAPSSRMKPTER